MNTAMPPIVTTETVLADLAAWSTETRRPLDMPPHEIAYRERCGLVVDLETGASIYPANNFADFAQRWRDYRRRRGLPADADALARALQTAFADSCDFAESLWQTIAATLTEEE